MTKVFIGGSRHVSRLPALVRERIDRIIEKELPVIIGDAAGADKAIQMYLSNQLYRNVEVFCAGSAARNNMGGWLLRKISGTARPGSLDFYTEKDRAMTDEATVGLMVWDGKSAGTLLNAFRLLNQEKKVVVYVSPEKQFRELKNLSQWDEFISACGVEICQKIQQRAAAERNILSLGPPRTRAMARVDGQHP
jgi:adenine-specific DNA-methyltransferase